MEPASQDWQALEERIGYTFRQPELLERALTHPSWLQEQNLPPVHSNQRLEFLGDAVINLTVSELLYERFPGEPEGFLTRQRASLVKGPVLVRLAGELNLDAFIRKGKSEINAGLRGHRSRMEDALEALFGAVFLDGGLEAARALGDLLYADFEQLLEAGAEDHNAKGRFQEFIQESGGNTGQFSYELAEVSGPDHDRRFGVELHYEGRVVGRGQGRTRKAAENMAAREALEQLRPTGNQE